MGKLLWLGVLWPVVLLAVPNVFTVHEQRTSHIAADTTYVDDRFAALVPGVEDTVIIGTDTFAMLLPDPDSIGTGNSYRAIKDPTRDSFLVLSYDVLVAVAKDSAFVDSVWQDWGLGVPYAYDVPVPGDTADDPYANEPAGFVVGTDFPFIDTLNAPDNDWDRNQGTPNSVIVVDAERDSVGRMVYPVDMVSGGAPDNWYFKTVTGGIDGLQADSLYVAYYLKLSSNWDGQSSGVNKTLYVSRDGKASAPVYYSAQGDSAGALLYQVRLQGLTSQVMAGNQGANDTIYRDQWHFLEHLHVLNTTDGVADGITKVWIDGTLTHYYTNNELWANDGNGRYWASIKWNPIWGGGSGDTIRVEQYQYVDHIYVSGNDNS